MARGKKSATTSSVVKQTDTEDVNENIRYENESKIMTTPGDGSLVTVRDEHDLSTKNAVEEENGENSEAIEEDEMQNETDSEEEDDDFFASLTAEQIALIKRRQDALKSKYSNFAEKQEQDHVHDLVDGFGLTIDEAKAALQYCAGDDIECKKRLTEDDEFIDTVREELMSNKLSSFRASKLKKNFSPAKKEKKGVDPTEKVKIEINMFNGVDGASAPVAKGSRKHKFEAMAEDDEDIEDTEGLGDLEKMIRLQAEKSKKRKSEVGFKVNGEKRAKNIRLGDALALLKERKIQESPAKLATTKTKENERMTNGSSLNAVASPKKTALGSPLKQVNGDLEPRESVCVDGVEYKKSDLITLGWSEARIKSFLSINSNPNSYYYRFNAPGEEQRTGEWSQDEIDHFMEAIKDGCNYRWGEFSITFPGRVGYQCSNFYRKLIQDGIIKDPNYVEVDGKLKFLGKDGKRFERKIDEAERKEKAKEERELRKALKKAEREAGADKPAKKAKKKSSKRKSRGRDVIRADDAFTSDESSESESDDDRGAELIKGLMCPMTMRAVRDPTLSPYGHIMGYDTWLKILNKEPRNMCPFTHQKLTRRSLIKLTPENIPAHIDDIKKVKADFTMDDVQG